MKMKDFWRPSGGALLLRVANAMNVKRFLQTAKCKQTFTWLTGTSHTETSRKNTSGNSRRGRESFRTQPTLHESFRKHLTWIRLHLINIPLNTVILHWPHHFCCVGSISCFVSRHFLCGTCVFRTCLYLDRNIHWSESSCLDCFTQGVRMFYLKL